MNAKKILIADDDLRLLEALSERLTAEGFEVVTTQDAYQALDRARRLRPDLLLLDVNMPAGNGFSVLERIGKIEELADIPTVYITGESSDAVYRTASELGAYAVVHKPFSTRDLLETIRGALGEEANSL